MASLTNAFVRRGRKIIGIGWNYRLHVAELGSTLPNKPLFFLKPTSSYVQEPLPIVIPSEVGSIHHEVELAVVLGRSGKAIPAEKAEDYIAGYAVGIDVTARELQTQVRKAGEPWTECKGYDTFTPISNLISKERVSDRCHLGLWLKVNGMERQRTSCSDMIFDVPHLIEHVSRVMTLEEGDVLLTGTPAGVGPLVEGDRVEAGLTYDQANLISMAFTVTID